MKKVFSLTVALMISAGLFGCAAPGPKSQAMLTYESNPLGATLYEGGVSIGVAPVTRTYSTDGKTDIITTPDVTAVWASGAKASYFTNIRVGADLVATIERPSTAAGMERDMAVAKPLFEEKERARQAKLEADKRVIARDSAKCQESMASGNATAQNATCF